MKKALTLSSGGCFVIAALLVMNAQIYPAIGFLMLSWGAMHCADLLK